MGAANQGFAYIGQIRYGIVDGWVDVSEGWTLREAASGAAAAYRDTTDVSGRHPHAVRVVRIEANH
jgi:hypothetical protein